MLENIDERYQNENRKQPFGRIEFLFVSKNSKIGVQNFNMGVKSIGVEVRNSKAGVKSIGVEVKCFEAEVRNSKAGAKSIGVEVKSIEADVLNFNVEVQNSKTGV